MDREAVGVCVFAFALYANTLGAGFVYDDSRAVLRNPDVLPSSPLLSVFSSDYWGTPLTHSGSHGSYRPLTVLSLRLSAFLAGGLQPLAFHVGNAILHVLASWLVLLIARRLVASGRVISKSSSRWSALVAAALFAAHPVHCEAVAGVVGRADLLACVFYLLSLLCYLQHVDWRERKTCTHAKRVATEQRDQHCLDVGPDASQDIINVLLAHVLLAPSAKRRCKWSTSVRQAGVCPSCRCWAVVLLVGSLVLATCSTLSKEPGATVLGVCAAYEILMQRRRYYRAKQHVELGSLMAICSWTLCLVGARLWVMGLRTPHFATADNPAANSGSFITRTLTFLYLPVVNLRLLLWPVDLSFDWSMDAIPRIQTLFDSRNFLSAILYFGLYRLSKIAIVSLTYKVEECEADDLDAAMRRIKSSRRGNSNKVQQQQHQKNRAWVDSTHSTTTTTLLSYCDVCNCDLMGGEHTANCQASNNNNTLLHNRNQSSGLKSSLLGGFSCLCAGRDHPSGSVKVRRSSSSRPPKVLLHSSELALMCICLLVLPVIPSANLFFYVGFVVAERVLYIPSVGYCLLVALGAKQILRTDNQRRHKVVKAAIIFLVVVFSARTILRNRDWQDEESLYRSGIIINPPKAYGNLGSVLSSMGRLSEAESAFKMALKYRPNMADVHYNLGNLFARKGQHSAAIQSYQQAIRYRPSLALAYLNLGHVLASAGKLREAVDVLWRCAGLSSEGLRDPAAHQAARVSALLLLGHLHAGQGQLVEAQNVLQLALQTRPSDYQPAPLYKLMNEVTARLNQEQLEDESSVPESDHSQGSKAKNSSTTQTSITAATPLNNSRCGTAENHRFMSNA